jgi:hypothetical protein
MESDTIIEEKQVLDKASTNPYYFYTLFVFLSHHITKKNNYQKMIDE